MGFYFRKSKSLGNGLRLNFSKNGIGISGGVKGARLSLGPSGVNFYGSIPGTGIYYRKKLSGSNTSFRTDETNSEYSRTIVNDYTGETRTVRANSQWELDELVRAEEARMEANEIRIRRNEEIQSQNEQAEYLTQQAEEVIDALNHLISSTLSVNDRLNWDDQIIHDEFPEFVYDENSENDRATQLQIYLQEKELFEEEKREHNADVMFLKNNFEYAEGAAIEKYASVVLANSNYPTDLDVDFDVTYNAMAAALIVSILLPDIDEFPSIRKYEYNEYEGIKEIHISDVELADLYEKTLLSVGLRTIHELFEAIYNGSVETILAIGCIADDQKEKNDNYSQKVRKIFKIRATAKEFKTITLTDENVLETAEALNIERIKDFTNSAEELQED